MSPFHPRELVYASAWLGYPILGQYSPFVEKYLYRNLLTIEQAAQHYPRVLAARFDLHLPPGFDEEGSGVISRFFASLNSQIHEDYVRHAQRGVYLNSCRLRYVWAKERGPENGGLHYHVGIFLNHKRYAVLGRYAASTDTDWSAAQRNMAHRINKAWYSATDCLARPGQVEYPVNAIYVLDRRRSDFVDVKADLFCRLSYLAKVWTKEHVPGRRYGCSRG